MLIVIVYVSVSDVISFEIYLSSLVKPFSYIIMIKIKKSYERKKPLR